MNQSLSKLERLEIAVIEAVKFWRIYQIRLQMLRDRLGMMKEG